MSDLSNKEYDSLKSIALKYCDISKQRITFHSNFLITHINDSPTAREQLIERAKEDNNIELVHKNIDKFIDTIPIDFSVKYIHKVYLMKDFNQYINHNFLIKTLKKVIEIGDYGYIKTMLEVLKKCLSKNRGPKKDEKASELVSGLVSGLLNYCLFGSNFYEKYLAYTYSRPSTLRNCFQDMIYIFYNSYKIMEQHIFLKPYEEEYIKQFFSRKYNLPCDHIRKLLNYAKNFGTEQKEIKNFSEILKKIIQNPNEYFLDEEKLTRINEFLEFFK